MLGKDGYDDVYMDGDYDDDRYDSDDDYAAGVDDAIDDDDDDWKNSWRCTDMPQDGYGGDESFPHDGKQGRCGCGEGYSWDDNDGKVKRRWSE